MSKSTVTLFPGVTLLEEKDRIPVLRVTIQDAETLARLRRLAEVDYIEPAFVRGGFSYAESGCSTDPYTGRTVYSASGDIVSERAAKMQIDVAWNRSQGDNITIGLTDTGIYASSQQMHSGFLGGQSWERWVYYKYASGYTSGLISDDECSHGTRMAGLMTAPRDGIGPVGVAWKANLVSVRMNNDIKVFDAGKAVDAIGQAASLSHIVVMAWGSPDMWFNSIEAEIESWYYGNVTLFIGAAGSLAFCFDGSEVQRSNVVFPAEMIEVVAVTAVDELNVYEAACNSHYGPEVELASYQDLPTASRNGDVVTIHASSSATAMVAGAAALVWARFGGTRDDVIRRLKESAHLYASPSNKIGYGIINAHKALGGMWYVAMNSCSNQTYCEHRYKLAACETKTFSVSRQGGDGPFTYEWSTGGTETSTTMQLCPTPGKEEYYSINVIVKDHSDGTSVYRQTNITVVSSDPDGACPTCPV